MSRTFQEDEFFKLLKTVKPNVIYAREGGAFRRHIIFWFNDKDGIGCKIKEECVYCIIRIQEKIEKLGIAVVGCATC